MSQYDLPDHPVIRNMERTGYPDGKEPTYPHCPICGEECETMYKDRYGAYVGCDVCTETKDAWEVPDCFPEKEYRGLFLKIGLFATQKDYQQMYEALQKGDPKLRSFRALYQIIYSRYIEDAKAERREVRAHE